MNATLQHILETGVVHTRDGAPRSLRAGVDLGEGQFLQEMIRTVGCRNSIEIGCAYGVSSLFICEAGNALGARHTIIDPFQDTDWESVGLLNIERAGFRSMIRFIPEFSHRALARLEASGERFEFAFIDGQHTFDYVLVDFFFLDRILEVGGVIVLDDIGYPSIRKVCRYILTNLPYRAVGPSPDPAHMGWKRRAARTVAAFAPKGHRLFLPELRIPDEGLGLPSGRYVALKKTHPNEVGNGTGGTRHWGLHREF